MLPIVVLSVSSAVVVGIISVMLGPCSHVLAMLPLSLHAMLLTMRSLVLHMLLLVVLLWCVGMRWHGRLRWRRSRMLVRHRYGLGLRHGSCWRSCMTFHRDC